jgi:hypothetical protein
MAKIGGLALLGLLLGLLALWYVEPKTAAGATFLVLLVMLVTNVVGHGVIVAWARFGRPSKPNGTP